VIAEEAEQTFWRDAIPGRLSDTNQWP